MSKTITLRVTTTDGGSAQSVLPVARAEWDALPESGREILRDKVRGMHANYLQVTRGVSVDASVLPVEVDGTGLVRPDEEPT